MPPAQRYPSSTTSFLACLAFAAFVLAPVADAEGTPVAKGKIEEVLYHGDYDKANELFKKKVGTNKASADDYVSGTICAIIRASLITTWVGDPSEAVAVSHEGLLKYPNDINLLAAHALALIVATNEYSARTVLNQAIKIGGDKNGFVHAVMSFLKLRSGESQLADSEAAKALALDGRSPRVNFVLARMHEERTNKVTAITDYARWTAAHPEHAFPLFARVFIEPSTQAQNHLNDALKINPNYKSAYATRGKVYFDQKIYKQAIADWDRAESLGKIGAKVIGNRGDCHAKLGHSELAIKDYTTAIAEFESLSNVQKNDGNHQRQWIGRNRLLFLRFKVGRAEAYVLRGRDAEAIADARSVLAANPEDVGALNALQNASVKLKDYRSAISALTRLIGIDPDVYQWYEIRSDVYNKMGNLTESKADSKRAKLIEEKGSLD